MPDENVFGFRKTETGWFVGNQHVEFNGNVLLIDEEKYTITEGLLNLLTQHQPKKYTSYELNQYNEILLLSDAHRWGFQRNNHIRSSKSWKYLNIISKLFPPKRKYIKSDAKGTYKELTLSINKNPRTRWVQR